VSNKDVKQDALDNLADALTEDIFNTPDDELLREVEEDYGDPHALANKFDQILERAEKQAFGAARPAASSQTQSSFRAQSSLLYYRERMLDWLSTLFGNRTVLAGAAATLIVLFLAPVVFSSISEFNERSRQLAAQEKEQLARSEQLAAQEKELLARSEQLAARERELFPVQTSTTSPVVPAAEATATSPAAQAATRERSILCETSITEPQGAPLLVCADADLAFWQKLVSEIYQHRWKQLDINGQKILRQGQLDWLLRDMRVHCNAAFQASVSGTEMARAKSCVLQSTKKRVAVLSNN
jgi:uncharacterized protein YecT (DUF1311 family)